MTVMVMEEPWVRLPSLKEWLWELPKAPMKVALMVQQMPLRTELTWDLSMDELTELK